MGSYRLALPQSIASQLRIPFSVRELLRPAHAEYVHAHVPHTQSMCMHIHTRMRIYRTINNSLHLARDLVSHPRAPEADGLALGVEERHLEPPGLPADLDAARQGEQ